MLDRVLVSPLQKLTTPSAQSFQEAISMRSTCPAVTSFFSVKLPNEANLCATSSFGRCYEILAMFRQRLMAHSLERNKLLKQRASGTFDRQFCAGLQ
jgi:hypothetical protein